MTTPTKTRKDAAVTLRDCETRKRKAEEKVISAAKQLQFVTAEYDKAKEEFDEFFPVPKRLLTEVAEFQPIIATAEGLSNGRDVTDYEDWIRAYNEECDKCNADGAEVKVYESMLYPKSTYCYDCRGTVDPHTSLTELVDAVGDDDNEDVEGALDEEWVELGPEVGEYKCNKCSAVPKYWLLRTNYFTCVDCKSKP